MIIAMPRATAVVGSTLIGSGSGLLQDKLLPAIIPLMATLRSCAGELGVGNCLNAVVVGSPNAICFACYSGGRLEIPLCILKFVGA